jgi:hypothetical protein
VVAVKLFGEFAWLFAWVFTLVGWASLYWVNCRLMRLLREQTEFYASAMADQRKLMADVFLALRDRYRTDASVDDAPGP